MRQARRTATLLLAGLLAMAGFLPGSTAALAAEAGSPYPESPRISAITFFPYTHKRRAPGSDNWPITWSADDHQYTAWGDGGGFAGTDVRDRVSLGFARLEGPAATYRARDVWGGPSSDPGQVHGQELRHPGDRHRAPCLALRRRDRDRLHVRLPAPLPLDGRRAELAGGGLGVPGNTHLLLPRLPPVREGLRGGAGRLRLHVRGRAQRRAMGDPQAGPSC
jgi:hypothetical protein